MIRTAILLGNDFYEWLHGKWRDKWKRHPQPPSFYWTFESMIASLKDFDPLIILDNEKPFAHGALTGSEDMTKLRFSLMEGFENAKQIFKEANNEFQQLVNRDFGGMFEVTGDKTAKIAVMALGTMGEELEVHKRDQQEVCAPISR